MRALPIDSIPDMPPFLLGVSMVRGAVVPVVDLAKLVGNNADAIPARFITVKLGERRISLAVESVVGIRRLSPESIAEIPLLLSEVDNSIVAAITTLDAELLLVLQSARLIPEPVWKMLDVQVQQA